MMNNLYKYRLRFFNKLFCIFKQYIKFHKFLLRVPNWDLDKDICYIGCNINLPLSTKIKGNGRGVTIDGGCSFGENVSIYQNVIIGTGRKPKLRSDGIFTNKPKIGDNVVVFSFASIIGGIVIGHDSVIGAYSLVLNDVPPYSLVYGIPAKVIRSLKNEG